MKSILNISYLTILESIRKKLFFVVLIVIAAICLASVFSGGEEGLKRSLGWSFASIHYFGLLLVLFLAGTSIPEDLESRRITLLLSKPLYRSQFLIAKFLGFCGVLMIYLVLTGGITGLSQIGANTFLHTDQTPLKVWNPIQPKDFQFHDETASFAGTIDSDSHQDRIAIRGSESRNPFVYWQFPVPTRQNFDQPPVIKGKFKVRGPKNQFSIRVRFLFQVPVEKKDGSVSWETLPTGQKLKLISQNQNVEIPLPWKQLKKFGKFRVRMGTTNPASQFRFHRNSLILHLPTGYFLTNLLKALVLFFLMFSILVGLLMAVSTVFSAPVSIFIALSFYLTCSAYGFLRDSLRTVKQMLETSYAAGHQSSGHTHAPDYLFPEWIMELSNTVTEFVLSIVPNFNNFFTTSTLIQEQQISFQKVLNSTWMAGGLVLFFLSLGMILFFFREVT